MQKRSSDKLQTVVLAYKSIHSALRPAVVSIDRISEYDLTVDHTHFSDFDHRPTAVAVVTTESMGVTSPCKRGGKIIAKTQQ